MSSVPETARPKLSCSKWLDAHHADLLAAGHTSAESLELFAAGEAAGYSRQQCRVAVSSHPDFKIMTRAAKNTTWSITGADTGYKPASNWVIDYLDTLPANTQTVDKAHFRQAAGEAGYGWDAARHAIIKCGRVETVPAVGNSRADTIWHITAPDAEESA